MCGLFSLSFALFNKNDTQQFGTCAINLLKLLAITIIFKSGHYNTTPISLLRLYIIFFYFIFRFRQQLLTWILCSGTHGIFRTILHVCLFTFCPFIANDSITAVNGDQRIQNGSAFFEVEKNHCAQHIQDYHKNYNQLISFTNSLNISDDCVDLKSHISGFQRFDQQH